MTTVIHDLENNYEFQNKYQEIISANRKYAPCQGCFGCWTKHPAECYMKDSLQRICRVIGKTDNLIIITKNCYGTYSTAIKNVLDRSIGLSTPFSTYRGKQMHHTLRYGKKEKLTVYAYGDMTDEEKETFIYMVERNAINYGFRNFEFHYLESVEEIEGLTL